MSWFDTNDKLRNLIERGDVEAVDEALQSGIVVSPDSEVSNIWRANRSLLFFAVEVCVRWIGICLSRYLLYLLRIVVRCNTLVRSKRRG